jgi:hypothetical protein
MSVPSLGSTVFLSVTHALFIEECGDVAPEQDQQVTQLLERFIINFEITHTEFSDSVSAVLGHEAEFPNRIHTILTVPSSPPPGRHHSPLSRDGTRRQNPWTEAEDNRLLCAIHKYGVQNWPAVAAFVGSSRSRAQCSQRWNRGLNPQLRKYVWSPSEEDRLCELVSKYGVKAWTRIAHELGTRSDMQCRYHFLHIQGTRRQPPGIPRPTIAVREESIDLQTANTTSTWDLFAPDEGPQLLSFQQTNVSSDPFVSVQKYLNEMH